MMILIDLILNLVPNFKSAFSLILILLSNFDFKFIACLSQTLFLLHNFQFSSWEVHHRPGSKSLTIGTGAKK